MHPYSVMFYIMDVFTLLLAIAEVYLKEGDTSTVKGKLTMQYTLNTLQQLSSFWETTDRSCLTNFVFILIGIH